MSFSIMDLGRRGIQPAPGAQRRFGCQEGGGIVVAWWKKQLLGVWGGGGRFWLHGVVVRIGGLGISTLWVLVEGKWETILYVSFPSTVATPRTTNPTTN